MAKPSKKSVVKLLIRPRGLLTAERYDQCTMVESRSDFEHYSLAFYIPCWQWYEVKLTQQKLSYLWRWRMPQTWPNSKRLSLLAKAFQLIRLVSPFLWINLNKYHTRIMLCDAWLFTGTRITCCGRSRSLYANSLKNPDQFIRKPASFRDRL